VVGAILGQLGVQALLEGMLLLDGWGVLLVGI